MPYFAIVYAVCFVNHFGSRLMGGDRVRMCALSDCLSHSIEDLASRNEPRVLMSFIRSYFFIETSSVLRQVDRARVVDDDVDAAERLGGLGDGVDDEVVVAYVADEGSALPPASSIAAAAV